MYHHKFSKWFLPLILTSVFLHSLSLCTPSPYFRSTLLNEISLRSNENPRCTMVANADHIEYFVCETSKEGILIRIIPSTKQIATMVIHLDAGQSRDSLESIIEKEIRQISISGEYLLQPSVDLKNMPEKIRLRLYFQSLPKERYYTEALFIVDKYILNIYKRDKPRADPR